MSSTRSLFNNTGILLVSSIADKGVGFLGTILLANYLGAERLGVFGAALVTSAIAARISELGIPLVVQRNAARQPDISSELFASSLAARLLTSGAMLVLLIAYSVILNQDALSSRVLIVAGLFNIATGLTQIAFAVFLAGMKMKYQAICTIMFRLLYLGSILVVIFFKGSVIEVIGGMTVASVFQLVLAFWILRRFFFRLKVNWSLTSLFHLIGESIPIGIASMFVLTYDRVDTVILSWLVPSRDVGNYYAGYTVFLSTLILSNAFTSSMYSVLSTQAKGPIIQIARTYWRSLGLTLILGGSVAIFLFVVADGVGIYIYGGKYESLPTILRWLSIAVIFVHGNNLGGVALNALGREKVTMWMVGAGVFMNVVLNLLLIPSFGVVAAAKVTAITEASVFLMTLVYLGLLLDRKGKRELAGGITLG